MQIVANNKKAFFEYFILEKIEAGIELTGSEVKSLRVGKASIKEAYAETKKGQLCVIITKSQNSNINLKIIKIHYFLLCFFCISVGSNSILN